MSTIDELLAAAAAEENDDKVLVIDNDLRTISIPYGVKCLGVESDADVLLLQFRMPSTYCGFDLSEFAVRINYMNAKGEGDVYPVTDAVVDADAGAITFSWLVGRRAVAYRGATSFIVCLKKVDATGAAVKEFNTTTASLPVLAGLETSEKVAQQNTDVLEGILLRLDKLDQGGASDEQIAKAVGDYMAEHGYDSGQNGDSMTLTSPDGNIWKLNVSNDGVVTATKYSGGGSDGDGGNSGETEDVPTSLESYTIFVPENVSDEWTVSSKGKLDMSTAEFLELFYDDFVSSTPYGVTVTKTSIGKDETGQYDMWEYDFCPENYSRTILLSSGMHTYELAASFGLANFIGHLYTDTDNEAFSYIRQNVRVKVIPVVNPWGFNQYPKTYGNANGVNPNRNFDLDGEWAEFEVYSPDHTASNYNEWNVKGVSPFSEAEAVNLAKWAMDNWNAEFWIDCHTGEGYSDKDLWVYYSSNSRILGGINGAISAIEAWFKETYGIDCVTTRTIDSAGSIRLRWAEECCGFHSMTLEHAPGRTTFGTSASNEAADISNYSTNISTFVQEFLMEKYRSNNVVEITGVAASNITISGDTLSVTAEAVMTPSNTTQNKFKWESSDESVVAVYGCTNKAIIVRKGEGTATITLTNHEKTSVSASFTVTVESDETFMEIGAGIRKVDSSTGYMLESTNRVTTDLIPVEAGNLTVSCGNGFYIKAWQYDTDGIATGDVIGDLTTNSISGTVSAGYIRVLYKRSDNSDISETAMQEVTGTINGAKYTLVATTEEVVTTFNIGAAIRGVNTSGGFTEHSDRILTDYILIMLPSANTYTMTLPTGFIGKVALCDESGTPIGDFLQDTQSNTFEIKGWKTDVVRGRLYIMKTDISAEITESEMLAIQIETSTGITYQLVKTKETE